VSSPVAQPNSSTCGDGSNCTIVPISGDTKNDTILIDLLVPNI